MIELKRTFRPDALVSLDTLSGVAFRREAEAHRFLIAGPAPFTGEVTACFRRADGITLVETGSLTAAGEAAVTLTDDCYQVAGRLLITIYVTDGGVKTCVYAGQATVFDETGRPADEIVDGGTMDTVEAMLAALMQDMEEAAQIARTAEGWAHAAEDAAEDAGEAARTAVQYYGEQIAIGQDAIRRQLGAVSDTQEDHGARLDMVEDRVAGKAEASDLAGLYAAEGILSADVADIRAALAAKTDRTESAALVISLEQSAQALEDLRQSVPTMTDVAAAAADTSLLRAEMGEALAGKADRSDAAALALEADRLSRGQDAHGQDIAALRSADADLMSGIAARVSKPATDGTSGQVLSTDGEGGTAWIDAAAPTDEQIGEAVAEWLDDHPEATTTVEDGSVTLAKLSADVRAAIEEAAEAGGDQSLGAAVAVALQRHIREDHEVREHLRVWSEWRGRMWDYASLFRADGIGFLFYTDPHSLSDHMGMTMQDALGHLRIIRRVFEGTPARYVLFGGDWIDDAHTLREAMGQVARLPNLLRSEIGGPVYLTAGNHDFNTESVGEQHLTQEQLARIWFDRDVGYYVIDGDRTACVVFDSGPWDNVSYYWQDAYDTAQAKWFAALLRDNQRPHLYGLIHNLAPNDTDGWLDGQITAIADAFNRRGTYTVDGVTYDFADAAGTFHFFLAGHIHTDTVYTRHNIPIVYTTHSRRQLALDCGFADFDAAVLHMVRIGSGESREIPIIPNGGYEAAEQEASS